LIYAQINYAKIICQQAKPADRRQQPQAGPRQHRRDRDDTAYAEAEGSTLLGISTAELASRIDWPPVS